MEEIISALDAGWVLLQKRLLSETVQHYGRRALCRVLGALPSVETRALGKEVVCRVPHSAKPALGKGHLCRVPNTRQKRDTRQTSSLPSVRHSAKNNPRQNTSGDAGGPSVILCRVLAVSTRQTCCLCRVSGLALGKEVPLPSANSDTRQSIFFYFCFQIFSVAFIQYLEAHVPI